jgi:hypothetical protein
MARDEALAELARRYITSRGPVSQQDFIWWSGLSASEARAGFEACRSCMTRREFGGHTYWMSADLDVPVGNKLASVFALPGFDEYLLGYRDRGAVLDAAHARKVCPGGNGVFAPTIIINGKVVGTWKRSIGKSSVEIVASPFSALRAAQRRAFEGAAKRYATFLGLAVSLAGR